jgi:hypothetical protein
MKPVYLAAALVGATIALMVEFVVVRPFSGLIMPPPPMHMIAPDRHQHTAGGSVSSGPDNYTQLINAQTGSTYAITPADGGKLITRDARSSCADTLAATPAGYSFDYENIGTTPCTITMTNSTIVIGPNSGCTITSDGKNYQLAACITAKVPDRKTMVVDSGLSLSASGSGTITPNDPAHLSLLRYGQSQTWIEAAKAATPAVKPGDIHHDTAVEWHSGIGVDQPEWHDCCACCCREKPTDRRIIEEMRESHGPR